MFSKWSQKSISYEMTIIKHMELCILLLHYISHMLWLWLTIVWEIVQIHTYIHTNTHTNIHTYTHPSIHTYLLFHRLTQNIPIQHHKGKGKGVPVCTMKAYNGSRSTAPHILNLRARRRRAVNITLQLLYAWEGTPVSVELKARWTLELVRTVWRRGKSLTLPRIKPQTVQPVS